jgi:GNAT superfamily N-acetyltransferase
MKTLLLDKNRHDRQQFNCGVEALNNYLKAMASQQLQKDNTRTFVLEDEAKPERIIGYYSLAMTRISLVELPDKLQKKHTNTSAGGLIARLAVDKRYAKQGYGEWLLVDALKRLLTASDAVAFPVVIVDAKDGAIDFYKKFGFTNFQDSANKLFITIADVRASFNTKS